MMQAATQATLSNLVEQHLTSLIREAATVNRHSKRGDIITAAADDKAHDRQRKRRRIIHHDDVNMALQWRGSEKLYVSGVVTPPKDDISAKTANKQTKTDPPTLVDSTTVPRIDLNTYLSSKNTLRPPSELGMTLHWLAVDGVSPLIPMNSVYNQYRRDVTGEDLTSGQDITDVVHIDNAEDPDSSIRIRELQHRLLSEELQLYYSRVITAISSADSSSQIISTALHGIRYDKGIQELVPFLCRFIAAGLMDKKNLRNTEYARRLVRVFDALLENRSLHLDLHLHQVLIPVGTCIVAKKLCINPNDDHWILRQEAAECFAKVCRIYNDQYSTLKPRCIKLLTQQALRLDRPLSTQYGGIVAISLFGPRAVDAFLLPLAKKYWMTWEAELKEVMAFRCKRNMIKEYELHMCQQALLNAIGIFLQNVSPQEQAKRVDIVCLADVFGEKLLPYQQERSSYLMATL